MEQERHLGGRTVLRPKEESKAVNQRRDYTRPRKKGDKKTNEKLYYHNRGLP